ncbi:HTH_Tnp_Tc3_2 domain-containing protein [Trichonephila clavipes]|nr:HTH_Tnp_Tc3_2 domain-containing protein [Trichonephila clavipes]
MNQKFWCSVAATPCSNSWRGGKFHTLKFLQPSHGTPNPRIRLASPLVWCHRHPNGYYFRYFPRLNVFCVPFSVVIYQLNAAYHHPPEFAVEFGNTRGFDRCPLHEDRAQDALDRPIRREDHHIVRNAHVQLTASSAAIQAQVTPSLGVPVSSQTKRGRLAQRHLGSRCPLHVLPLTPTHRRLLLWSDAAHEETGLQRNGTRSSLAMNPDSISAVTTIVFVCGDPVRNATILRLLYSVTPLPQLV